ncbi:hypothetical protein Q2T83_08155 [Fervidibacter sacchari]|uniref:50S ribosomal protein L32 n=1 Tax=Candidatus Fervidibacter sacchari TaxID=1448929 RepID=A0ABT2ESQ8_9BACT|nr:hypothetical protein [Candidatus Fervidibacter sacchari]MCS3920895.1 hypothetical protein [Candidatus Fervidibacter sacchari]WKU17778.1 hypothetical protein Q2T83_08155 [Candidatus Fervidibacter sacchari]
MRLLPSQRRRTVNDKWRLANSNEILGSPEGSPFQTDKRKARG